MPSLRAVESLGRPRQSKLATPCRLHHRDGLRLPHPRCAVNFHTGSAGSSTLWDLSTTCGKPCGKNSSRVLTSCGQLRGRQCSLLKPVGNSPAYPQASTGFPQSPRGAKCPSDRGFHRVFHRSALRLLRLRLDPISISLIIVVVAPRSSRGTPVDAKASSHGAALLRPASPVAPDTLQGGPLQDPCRLERAGRGATVTG
jgi:hypothetical protein